MKVQIWFLKGAIIVLNVTLVLSALLGGLPLILTLIKVLPQHAPSGWWVGALVYSTTGLLVWSGYQVICILQEIDQLGVIGIQSAKALRRIRSAAVINSVLYTLSLPIVYLMTRYLATARLIMVDFGIILGSLIIVIGLNLWLQLWRPAER